MCFITLWCRCVAVSDFFDIVTLNFLASASLVTEMEKIGQMQEHFERLLLKAKDELEVLREKFNMTDQELKITQKRYVCCLKIQNMLLLKVVSQMQDRPIYVKVQGKRE